jgi:hypothetical protein
MTSKKARRYGQGGSNHKKNPNLDRPNGKAWKQFGKAFSLTRRRLVSTGNIFKGKTIG